MTGKTEPAQVASQHAVVHGNRMHYLKAGAGPDLLVLHGILGTAETWRPSIPLLSQWSTVYALDLLGMGESERVRDLDAGLPAQADRVAGFLDALGLASVDVLATSHGGAVAMMLAARHPGRVRSLTLHAPVNPFSRAAEPMVRFYKSRPGHWFAHQVPTMPRPLQQLALRNMYGDPTLLREGSLEQYVRSLRVPGTVDYVLKIVANWASDMEELAAALLRIGHLPAMLLWGDRDRAVELASATPLQRVFDHADLVVLPGVGHLPYEECPKPFAEAVLKFLTRLHRAVPAAVGPRLVSERRPRRA